MALPSTKIKIEPELGATLPSLDKVAAAIDKLAAAQLQYQTQLAKVAAAQKAGLVTTENSRRAIDKLEKEYKQAASAAAQMTGATLKVDQAAGGTAGILGKLSNASRTTRASIQNASFQLQDMVVQLQMGTRASLVMSQQLPQLASGFGAMGAVAGFAIAALIPLGVALLGGAKDAIAFEDAASDAAEALAHANDVLSNSTNTVAELAEKYGIVTDEVMRLQGAIERLALSQQQQSVEALRNSVAQSRALNDIFNVIDGYLSATAPNMEALLRGLEKSYGLTGREVIELKNAIIELEEVEDFQGIADAAANMREMLEGANQTKFGGVIAELVELEDVARQSLRNIEVAARQANEALQLRPSTSQVLTYGPTANLPEGGLSGIGAEFDPEEFREELSNNKNRGRRRGGGGGGGGGGSSVAAQMQARLNTLVDSLQTERETLEEWRSEGLELLASANEQELAVLGGHAEAKLRLEEEYQDRLSKIKDIGEQSRLMKGLSMGEKALAALGKHNEKALAISKVFGKAQALISTYQGAAEALKLPFPANLAAMAKVMAAGMGLVQSIAQVSKAGGVGGGGGAGATNAGSVVAQDTGNTSQAPMLAKLNFSFDINDDALGRKVVDAINMVTDDGARNVRFVS